MSYAEITSRLNAALAKSGRQKDAAKLIAVSKVQPIERVTQVLQAGHQVFGENRVQEAQERWGALLPEYPDTQLHLLGPLQSNKARSAMEMFQSIHSVDRPKLAKALARLAQELGHCPELFVQVNTGEEPQKAGIAPGDLDQFVADCRAMDLPIAGLMCLPPVDEEPALHFALLAKLAGRNGVAGLSMGMSGDFETAIAFGATHVRVGSAIFGARVKA